MSLDICIFLVENISPLSRSRNETVLFLPDYTPSYTFLVGILGHFHVMIPSATISLTKGTLTITVTFKVFQFPRLWVDLWWPDC